ncbi:MAG: glycerophosphodiester phosphodiesterase [Gemmatimonadetes bacterium]|nr:glycerophosphodiester phosphodiesterase [Gemmatimonadota bacterium]
MSSRLRASARPGYPYLAGAPLVMAHRGGSALAPENTLLAFRQAVEWWSSDILELDVHPTRDGEVVVIHDATLDRTTDSKGTVAKLSLAQVQRADAGHCFSPDRGRSYPYRGVGVRVPTLEELLRALPGMRLNVEIKDGRAQRRVWEVVHAAGAVGRVLIAAGKGAHRAKFARYAGPVSASGTELRSFYLAHRLRLAHRARPSVDAFQMPERYGGRRVLSPRLIAEAHARNVAVHVWTVNELTDMRRLLDWGVDGIVTDRPDRLAAELHRRSGRPLPPGPPSGAVPPSVERLLRA